MQNITIHTDGACLGNPGPGGFAAYITWNPADPNPGSSEPYIKRRMGDDWDDELICVSGGAPQSTNNRMEMAAAIEGLKTLNSLLQADNPAKVTVRSDSKYVTDAFNRGWLDNWQTNGWTTANGKPVLNQDLWAELLQLSQDLWVTWQWVKGHSGDYWNDRCDALAVEQARVAHTQPRYWVSVGNPLSDPQGSGTDGRTAEESATRQPTAEMPGGPAATETIQAIVVSKTFNINTEDPEIRFRFTAENGTRLATAVLPAGADTPRPGQIISLTGRWAGHIFNASPATHGGIWQPVEDHPIDRWNEQTAAGPVGDGAPVAESQHEEDPVGRLTAKLESALEGSFNFHEFRERALLELRR